jgi:hypothetical protein
MPYRIAGIDVHKKKLAVVVADVEVEDEYQFERRWCGEAVDVSTATLKSSRVCLESHAWRLFGCTVFFSLHQFTLL